MISRILLFWIVFDDELKIIKIIIITIKMSV